MAKLTHEDILAYLEEATILELNDLVKAIEEKFDVTAAAPVAVAAAADAGAAVAVDDDVDADVDDEDDVVVDVGVDVDVVLASSACGRIASFSFSQRLFAFSAARSHLF